MTLKDELPHQPLALAEKLQACIPAMGRCTLAPSSVLYELAALTTIIRRPHSSSIAGSDRILVLLASASDAPRLNDHFSTPLLI